MKYFKNNFLNVPVYNKPQDYIKISEEMAAIHSLCFKNSKHHLSQKSMYYYLKETKTHVFYNKISIAIIQVTDFEADLITIGVNPNNQGKGIGSKLLELISLYLKDLKVNNLFLEVDSNNNTAIKIYSNIGFKACGIRKNYYQKCNGIQSDASVMVYNVSRKNGKLDKKKLQRLYPTG